MALAMPPAAPSRSRSDPDAVLRDPTFRQSVAFIQDVQVRSPVFFICRLLITHLDHQHLITLAEQSRTVQVKCTYLTLTRSRSRGEKQTRFRPTPARFQEFLAAFEMLHQPGAGAAGASSYYAAEADDDDADNTGLPAVYDKMAALLGDQPDLLARFEAFLPHGYALRRRLEREAAAAEDTRARRWRRGGGDEGEDEDEA